MGKIRVFLVDDHAVVRTGLKMVIDAEEDMEVVGEAANSQEALQGFQELKPEVTIMDITMPGVNGLEASRQIRKDDPEARILILTMHISQEYFFQALHVGAAGYIPKSAENTELLSAIRTVHSGKVYLHPSVAQMLVSDYLERARSGVSLDPYESLTDRERQILQLVASGDTNREIAEKLYLSPNTVHNHRQSLMEKLGLHNRMELLKYALSRRLVE